MSCGFAQDESRSVVAKGAAVLMAAMLASRLLGYVREKAVTHYFGDKWWTDAFASAFNLPDLIYYLLAGGALGAALIPVLREYFARGDVEGGHRVANLVLNLMLVALLGAAVVAIVFAPPLVRIIARGYTPGIDPRYELTVGLTRVLMPQVVLMGISALLTALLQCHDHFTWPAVGWSVYNIGIIVGVMWLAGLVGGPPQRQIFGLAAGVILGAVLLVAIQGPVLRRVGFRWRPTLSVSDPEVGRVLRAWLPCMLALAFGQINLLWLPVVLGTYFGPGMVWSIRLAQRLILLPLSLFGISIATAAFPTLSTLAYAGRGEEMRRTFSRSLSSVLFFSLPSAAGLMVLALPLTRLLWKSGEYSEAAARANAQMLTFFALGVAGLCALQIINRAFFALREFAVPLKMGAGVFVLNLALCLLLMRTDLAYRGIALGTSIAFCVNALLLMVLLKKRMGAIGGRAIADSFLRSLVATGLMAGAAAAASGAAGGYALGAGLSRAALQVLAGMAAGIPVYLIAALLLKVPEAALTWQRIGRRLGWIS